MVFITKGATFEEQALQVEEVEECDDIGKPHQDQAKASTKSMSACSIHALL